MNKILIGVGIAVLVVLGWVLVFQSPTPDENMTGSQNDVDMSGNVNVPGEGEASMGMPADGADVEEMIIIDDSVDDAVSSDETMDETATSEEEVLQ